VSRSRLPVIQVIERRNDTIDVIMSGFISTSIARVVPDQQGKFDHRFGGPPRHRGTTPRGGDQPLHHLYTFDTTDPLVPVGIAGVRYLPLYYGFPYDAGGVGYRVISDDEIEIFGMENYRTEPDYPYPNYPKEFSETPIVLLPISKDEHDILIRHVVPGHGDPEVLIPYVKEHYSGSAAERDSLLRALKEASDEEGISYVNEKHEEDQYFLKESGYPFTQLGGLSVMWQGIPREPCPNKNCENHELQGKLDVFAVIWGQPVPGVFLWDDDENPETRFDEGVQIIFQICPLCQAIDASDRCD
jgi:hypothetical protein